MGNPFKAEFGAKTTIFNFIEEEKSIQTRFSSGVVKMYEEEYSQTWNPRMQ